VLNTFMDSGDILGHEPMGIVEVGGEVTNLNRACGMASSRSLPIGL
jgi:threonine dehydrogenase-like Zn-dependent dehydrogenase